MRPDWVVLAPGRVNLIGDHTDYNDLPVFPMAIQRAVTLVGRTRDDDAIRLVNVDPQYAACDFSIDPHLKPSSPRWANYVKAGVRAVAEHFGVQRGFDAVLGSTIPVAAGLSSSSAVVVAAGLAASRANELSVEPMSFTSLMAGAERFVGTHGGGMDQAICLGGVAGHAVVIHFDPLRLDTVAVPPTWRFVVAHSLEHAEKSGAVQGEYNRRTEECRSALGRVQQEVARIEGVKVDAGYPELLNRFGVEGLLALGERVLQGRELMRFRHTVSEAGRVAGVVDAMEQRDRSRFGRLMLDSHASLREDYEVSTRALDTLVSIMCDAGADGARLTGAGFGGCVVGLCAEDRIDAVQSAVKEFYYAPRSALAEAETYVFGCVPSAGARVTSLEAFEADRTSPS